MSRSLGIALLTVGVIVLLRGRGPGSLFVEFLWLTGLAVLAQAAWRAMAPRAALRTRILVLAAIGIVAVTSLKFLAGAAPLLFVALAFWLLYSTPRLGQVPWALIPAGVFGTAALVVASDQIVPGWNQAVIFALGMTATFTAVYLLPKHQGGGRWALWPALAWAFIILVANEPGGGASGWTVPLLLIGAGAVLLSWTRRGSG